MLIAALIVIMDPYFHYHKPFGWQKYGWWQERYINDGILKNFDYNAIIAGNSMVENFKVSEFNELFGTETVKVPYSGASFEEVGGGILQGLSTGRNVKYVLWCLDYSQFPVLRLNYEEDSYPWYLYDDNIFNDVNYVFNKEVAYASIYNLYMSIIRAPVGDFDSYAYWGNTAVYGKEVIYKQHQNLSALILEQDAVDKTIQNIDDNVLSVINGFPDTDFYIYFPPYSIVWWGDLNKGKGIEQHMEMEQIVIEKLLECPNVHLFSFTDDFDLICNLDNYKDRVHYSAEINSRILEWIVRGEHELTKDNYEAYLSDIMFFYTTYDYDALFD